MSWPRERLFVALLALFSPWALADTIAVNTTADDFSSNGLCSLRESMEFFNRGRPEGGFQGCTTAATGSLDVISLPPNSSPYLISGSAITVRTAVAINGEGRKDDKITTIQVTGAHRAFVINDTPVFIAPRCSPSCATTPTAFDLDAADDTGTAGDYLTTNRVPTFKGVLPGKPGATSAHSYQVTLYDKLKDGTLVNVGGVKVPLSTDPIPWDIKVTRLLAAGVHQLFYKTQEVDTLTNAPLGSESDLSLDSVSVAIYIPPERKSVRLSGLILRGGCAAGTDGCATDVNDDTVINDPGAGNTSYDPYALSYRRALLGTAGKGGIIFSNEFLGLSDVLIRDGQAVVGGGAIYAGDDGVVEISQSELRDSRADRGAAVYAAANAVAIDTSLLTANTVGNAAGAVVEVAAATQPTGFTGLSRVENSTVSGNAGRALSLWGGAYVRSSTIVLNTAGLQSNGQDVDVYNTILAGNNGADCEGLGAGTFANDLLLTPGTCPGTGSGNQYISGATDSPEQLMVDEDDVQCIGRYGLLCRLAEHGGATAVHMPHILEDYIDLSGLIAESPLINKGADKIGAEPDTCPGRDQRGEDRAQFTCDIGAVEMRGVGSGEVTLSGGSIVWGQEYVQFLGDDLADEKLLPARKCPAGVMLTVGSSTPALYPPPSLAQDVSQVVANSYRSDVPGCPWLEEAPTRGQVSFSADGNYHYRPLSNFHGFDRFHFRIVTTLSNLNIEAFDRSRLVRATVIVEPSTTTTSSKLGGALDAWGLLALGALGLYRRRGGRV